MPAIDAGEWLEGWVEENLNTPQYQEHKSAMAADAAVCRAQAVAAGISPKALDEAAEGDLEAYLLRAQNSFTDAEVQRKVDSDGN